jgi:hypothetical protein
MTNRREKVVTSRAVPFAALAWLITSLAGGCGGKDEGGSGLGVRGETCRSTKDCGSGLACIGSMCSIRSFNLSRTQNECVAIACRTVEDCLPSDCRSLGTACDGGDTAACSQYDLYCDVAQHACENDQCVDVCTLDAQCYSGTCVNGRCAGCATDVDCDSAESCIDGTCVYTACQEKADCPIFYDCQSGHCVEVGCANDRECIADTGTTRATCQNKECVVPCETDIQCDNPNAYNFTACIQGRCTPIGCESDSECRIIMNTSDFGGDAECRPVTN